MRVAQRLLGWVAMPSLSSSACAARLRAARRAARSPPVRVLRVRAGAEEDALLPPPQVKRFSRKAERRIAREGPRESDLRDEVGRIPKECLPRACRRRAAAAAAP